MKKAIGIFSEIKNLGSDKEKREELKEYCQQNIEQILQHLPQRILMSDGGCLLEYIFLGLPDKMKSKVVDKVLHKIRIEPVSITHCGDIISRVCSELPRLPVEDLVRWSSDSVQTIVDDVDVNMIWKDILPECLYTILSHDTIKHCGTEISGEEFKIQLVHTLCQCRYTERQLVPLCTMFKGMQLPRAELKQVVNKLCSYVVDLPPDALPPVVHQLLKLCKVEHMEIVLSHLSNYFNLKLYSTLKPAQQDSESTTIDVDDIAEHSTKELSQCLLTCLYHFTQGAADAEVIRKHIKKWPKLLLLASPFLINLALAVSDKGRMIRTVCLDAIKSAIEFHILDGLRRKESAWVRCSELPDIDVSRLLKILTTESTDLRQFTVLGLINLAFSLLSVSRVKPTAQACWSHGKLILVRLSKGQPETAAHILTELADRLLGEPQQQYSDCLHVLCKLTPVSIERCHTQLSTILESCQPVGDYTHAARTYAAVRPLVGFSARVRDCLVMVSRKGLYSRDSLYRCLALSGFLTVLREMKLSSKTPLARSQNSDQYSATSYLTQLTVDFHSTNQGIGLTSRTRKETICLEVISILRRCLVQDAAVKKVLYRELYECTKDKVVLHERILELLYEQLVKYLPDEDNEKPLLLDKCVQTTATGAVLVEPIGHLLFAIAQFLQPTEEEDLEDILQSPSDDGAAILRNKLTDVLEKLCGSDLLSLVDMEEPGLTDLTPESRAKCLKVQQLMQCLEALVAHRVMQWSLHNSLARSAYALYRAHNQLMDTTKGSPKVGRKNKTLNETGETSKSQKSQKDAKGKGKGKGKGKSATTVANLVKDRAAPFKALPCLWDTQFSLRILELLYSETIIWSTTQQRNDIRGKRDFHLFALRCVQAAVPEHVTKQTVSTHILNIATLVYKRCVCRFQDMSDFDEHTTYACLELFKACLTLVLSPKYSLKTESVLKGITGTVKQEAPESECLAEIIEKMHAALRKLESEAADDDLDLIGKKTFNMLVQITTVLLETPVLACDALNRTIVKLEEYLRDSKQPEILPMLSPLLTAAQREQQEATLLVDVLTDLTAALGVIDEESSSTDAQTHFPTINSTTGHTALSLVCTHLNSRFKCIEHSLHRARDLTEAVGIAVESHQSRLERERRELYKSIVLQLCQLTGWSCSAAKLRCNVGADSERVLGVCVRMFSILASMIKTLDADMAEFVRPELEKLLKFTGKKLSPSTDGLITYVAEAADEGETASKVLRRTKLNPRLVLEREQFCKHVILFGNKVKINFQQYLPEGPARDFKIKVKNSPQLLQDQANADDENDVSINDAETVILSGGSDNENHESASDSDAEPSASKRRRLS